MKKWEDAKVYAAADHSDKPKFYGLIEFPYPSGQGLHVGHPRPYTAMDIVTRKKRMDGSSGGSVEKILQLLAAAGVAELA